jgi:predicted transcriptional regulator
MKNRRSKLEIYIDVLQTIKEGTNKPTRIMYGANLSWKLLQDVLESMVEQDLIEEIDQSRSRDKRTNKIYIVTGKGDSVIKYFGHAKRLIDVDGEASFHPFEITKA